MQENIGEIKNKIEKLDEVMKGLQMEKTNDRWDLERRDRISSKEKVVRKQF